MPHIKVIGIRWLSLSCKMLQGQAKYKCVLDFKKRETVCAERKARDHAGAVLHNGPRAQM